MNQTPETTTCPLCGEVITHQCSGVQTARAIALADVDAAEEQRAATVEAIALLLDLSSAQEWSPYSREFVPTMTAEGRERCKRARMALMRLEQTQRTEVERLRARV